MSPAIVHLDMDAFYASVEQRDRPELRGRPVIVGGHRQRGVVVAASYEARPFGVRSAMPMVQALRLLPSAVVVVPRMDVYVAASEEIFTILSSVTPLVEPLSLDEAFLDVTGSRALFGGPARIAAHLRERIAKEVRLPSSAGIATVKFVAKIASDSAKPDGQLEIPEGGNVAFLSPLPIGRLWGVGKKTEEILHGLGIKTIGDLGRRNPDWLEARVPGGRDLWELSQGHDDRKVVPDREAKSLGAEDTFDEDLQGEEALAPHIHSQALRVGRRLRACGKLARVAQLKIKLTDFTVFTRRSTLPEPTDDGQVLYQVAMSLLEAEKLRQRVRLTGVSGQDLVDPGRQLSLFAGDQRRSRLNVALDRIADRFGSDAVVTGDLRDTEVGADRGLDRNRSKRK